MKNLEDGSALNRDLLQKTRNSLIELDQRNAREQQEISMELRNVKRLKVGRCTRRFVDLLEGL